MSSASNDNIRLWNVAEAGEPDASGKMKSGVQFKIIPGHHGGFISQMGAYRLASPIPLTLMRLLQSSIRQHASWLVRVAIGAGMVNLLELYLYMKSNIFVD